MRSTAFHDDLVGRAAHLRQIDRRDLLVLPEGVAIALDMAGLQTEQALGQRGMEPTSPSGSNDGEET